MCFLSAVMRVPVLVPRSIKLNHNYLVMEMAQYLYLPVILIQNTRTVESREQAGLIGGRPPKYPIRLIGGQF